MRITDLVRSRSLSRAARVGFIAKEVMEGLASGRHRSPHQGFSVEFRQHRAYVPGDAPATIDWKAYAKTDRLFVREYDDETSLRAYLCLDHSGSMQYRGDRSRGPDDKPVDKLFYGQAVLGTLAHALLRGGDQVGAVTFADRVHGFVPPKNSPGHLHPLLDTLCDEKAGQNTDLSVVLREVAAKVSRRSLIVIASDGGGNAGAIGKSLAQFRRGRHEVVWFHVQDPDEIDFPFRGAIEFEDLEQPGQLIAVDAASMASSYRRRQSEFVAEVRRHCLRHRVQWVSAVTSTPPGQFMVDYLASRLAGGPGRSDSSVDSVTAAGGASR